MNHKPLLRLLIITQTFLLFAVICIPLLIHYLPQTGGRLVYGCLVVICIVLALLLRRELDPLD
jgi:hypothetical protein